MSHVFRTITNPAPAQNSSEMATDLALEMIEGHKQRRLDAQQAEAECLPSLEWTPVDQERIDTLEALLKGRHRSVVLPLILEHFPEMIAGLPEA